MKKEELVYNVYYEDFNSRQIIKLNIFAMSRFYDSLVQIKKKSGEDFDLFSKEVMSQLMYYFWSKSEYEIILTSWPPYVESNEIERLCGEKHEFFEKNGFFFRTSVNLSVGEKIDIYDQVLLNWDIFIKYLWDNRNLLTKKRCDR